MAQDLSIEYPDKVVFLTIRTIASRLWFVNNSKLIEKILAFLAKYQEMFGVIIYGFIVMGNHYHLLAKFPQSNRAAFLKAFNSIVARLVSWYVPSFKDGKLWSRRTRVQVVPNAEDILKQFLYLALNPVSSGLCSSMKEFEGYSCLGDVCLKQGRAFRLVDWSDYKNRKRYNKSLKPDDCVKIYVLKFSRLPGYEKLSDKEYQAELMKLVEKQRQKIVKERAEAGQGFAGKKQLRQIKVGARPRSTKTSTRDSKRPLVLTICAETKQLFLEIYFSVVAAYKKASELFRKGKLNTEFPPGTYRPVLYVPH